MKRTSLPYFFIYQTNRTNQPALNQPEPGCSPTSFGFRSICHWYAFGATPGFSQVFFRFCPRFTKEEPDLSQKKLWTCSKHSQNTNRRQVKHTWNGQQKNIQRIQ
jgi:hypothetical protein